MKQILVLGSLNGDLVQRVDRLPKLGETLSGQGLQVFIGGKGANQACAAALLGANVLMAGKVGNDVFAERLIEGLQNAGVDTALVERSSAPTGTATIFVVPSGENAIVISAGANADISAGFSLAATEHLEAGDFLLSQLEVPLDSVREALTAAKKKGVTTILDPAPACAVPDELLSPVDILTPNQTEAATLLGSSEAPETIADAEIAAAKLLSRGARTVIIKMGALGCLVRNGEASFFEPGCPVEAVDTTAAGDAFNGALAVALSEGGTLQAAARFANAAAALSVTKPGAIGSMPTRAEVQQFLTSRSR